MPEKEEKQARLEEFLQIRTTPQIEAALAEQIMVLPQLMLKGVERGVKASIMGLVVCCIL